MACIGLKSLSTVSNHFNSHSESSQSLTAVALDFSFAVMKGNYYSLNELIATENFKYCSLDD
jgi:hypothetical protein